MPGPAQHPNLAALAAAESARIAAACIACGDCVRACPMTPYAAGVDAAEPGAVATGVLDILRGGAGTPEAAAWTMACTRSGSCVPACPVQVDPMLMLRLAKWHLTGALGGERRVTPKEDTAFAAKSKAFARLTFTDQEYESWM